MDYGKAMPSPLIKEKFSRSRRRGNRPSTVSSLSFLGSERSPRFYEKVVRWFRRKRGKEYCGDQFPAEKHSSVHHKAVLTNIPQLSIGSNYNSSISSFNKGSSLKLHSVPSKTLAYHHQLSGSLASSGSEFGSGLGSPRSTPSMSHKVLSTEHSSPSVYGGVRVAGRGPLSSTTSSASNNSLAAPPLIAANLNSTNCPANTSRGLSMESGYQSFSTCSSPANSQASPSLYKRDRSCRFRFLAKAFKAVKGHGKSSSFEVPENIPEHDFWSNSVQDDGADGRRRLFQTRTAVFHSAVDEEENEVGPDLPESRCDSRASSCINSSVFSGSLNSLPHSDTHEMVAITLGDFRIKYNELEFKTVLSDKVGSQIHTGKCQVWDVNIHSCCPTDDNEVKEWLADVRRLTQIRHENIVLYMGACVEPPKFAIITSLVNSDSLYNRIMGHGGKRLTSAGKLSILRQVANAMSYLHCKGIVHGRLSAHNIFLESTVKVSLLDYTPNLLNLQYLSPELIKTYDTTLPFEKSKEGDVYAFGTVMYQLSSQKLPFDNLASQTVMYLVGQNELASHISQLNLNAGLARMLEKCWHLTPESRPGFPALGSQLMTILTSVGSRRKHSLSEPRCLDQLGRTSVFA